MNSSRSSSDSNSVSELTGRVSTTQHAFWTGCRTQTTDPSGHRPTASPAPNPHGIDVRADGASSIGLPIELTPQGEDDLFFEQHGKPPLKRRRRAVVASIRLATERRHAETSRSR
jgi:hypothetical protein